MGQGESKVIGGERGKEEESNISKDPKLSKSPKCNSVLLKLCRRMDMFEGFPIAFTVNVVSQSGVACCRNSTFSSCTGKRLCVIVA